MNLMAILFFVSLLIVAMGAVVKPLQRIFLTEPFVSMAVGIMLSPVLLNLIPSGIPQDFKLLDIAAELTMAIALMATALRIPRFFYSSQFTTQSLIILAGMAMMWFASAGMLYVATGWFTFAESLLLGAVVTPTDPVVASTIVTGEESEKYLPASIRNTLSFESGVNDGLAYPLVLFSLYLVSSPNLPPQEWLMDMLLYETVLCGILAYGVGYLAGNGMEIAHSRQMMDTKSLLSFSLGLAFLLLSGLNLLEMNGVFGVFIGGIAYANQITDNNDIREERVQETMERLFTIPVFFIFGFMIPWQEWYSLGWAALWIPLLILVFRRVPALLALKPILPQFKDNWDDALMVGWFGPIGVAALFYAVRIKEKTAVEEVWMITSLIVFASTVVHGLTSLPMERWYDSYNK